MILLLIILGISIAVCALVILRKDNVLSLEALREKYALKSSNYFECKTLNCHYTDEGDGEIVLLIHGLGDSFKMFDKVMPLLAKNYRVIRLDLPGFGLSDIPGTYGEADDPIDFYRNFVKSFVEEKGLGNINLMGNSLGGLVSWEFAVNNQNSLKSLCLIASAGYEMDLVKKNITKGVLNLIPGLLLKKGMPINMAESNVAMVLNQKENRTSAFVQTHYDMINREGTLNYFLRLIAYKDVPEVADLKKLKVPTLISWGDRDKIIPARHADFFENDIQGAEKVIYTNCGHYPQVEYPEKFVEDWSRFINKV